MSHGISSPSQENRSPDHPLPLVSAKVVNKQEMAFTSDTALKDLKASRNEVEFLNEDSHAAEVDDPLAGREVDSQDKAGIDDYPFPSQEAYGQVHGDDPQLDWHTQGGALSEDDDDENSSGDDETALTHGEPTYTLPQSLRDAERHSTHWVSIPSEDRQVHHRYTDFLMILCEETATQDAASYAVAGLPYVISTAKSLAMDKSYDTDKELDSYAHALVVHVWLLVCHRIQHAVYPDEDESLFDQWTSYSISAHTLVQSNCSVSREELSHATRYWEQRLSTMGGGTSWLEVDWFRNIPEIDAGLPCPRNSAADEYLKALEERGIPGLAYFVLDKESKDPKSSLRHVLKMDDKRKLMFCEVIAIISYMGIELVEALIEGQIFRKGMVPFGEVDRALQRFNPPKTVQPSIYINCICDAMGISPTPAHWRFVCDKMLEYIKVGKASDDLAIVVDQLIHPTTKWPAQLANRGLRRYTEWKSYLIDEDLYPCDGRREMVRYFVDQMRKRIEVEDDHVPLGAPVIEIGFSITPERRLWEHRRHRNSNYLMNLAQAIFEHVFPGMFCLQQKIIFTCYRSSHPWLGEVVLTQLGQGYTEGAGGFSHYPAGYFNGSAYRKTPERLWTRFEATALSGDTLEKLMDIEAATAARVVAAKAARSEKERENEDIMALKIRRQECILRAVKAVRRWTEAEKDMLRGQLE